MATKLARYHSNNRPSSDVQALMVHIDWTDAKVVKMTARCRFTLQASTVSIIRGVYTVVASAPMPVPEGMTVHFVASDEFKGWYYICLKQNDGSFACTCPRASKFHLDCHHQDDAASFEARRIYRQAVPNFFQHAAMWASRSFAYVSREVHASRDNHAAFVAADSAMATYQRAHGEMFRLPAPVEWSPLPDEDLEAVA